MGNDLWLEGARQSYDVVSDAYTDYTRDMLSQAPLERAFLDVFAEQVASIRPGRVVDAGCGPGWVTRYLHDRGCDIRGFDLSPRLIRAARAAHPQIGFSVGSLTDPIAEPRSLAGIVCWFVLHHVPDAALPLVVRHLASALVPGGALLIGSHIGDHSYVKTDGYGGLPMNVLIAKRPLDRYTELFRDQGLIIHAQASLYPSTPAPTMMLMARSASQ